MKLLAIIECRGYAEAEREFRKEDGAKNLPDHWVELIMATKAAHGDY